MGKIVFLILFSSYLVAGTYVKERFNHYYINPKNVNEVKSQLFTKTPINIGGKKYLGETKWNIKYNLTTLYNTSYCKLDSVKIKLDVTYTMPQVAPSVPGALKHKFKRFYNKLLQHEKNHKKNAYQAAKEIEREIRKKSKEKNCDILYEKIDKLSKGIIKKYNRLDRLYDKRTQNGKSEGVVVDYYF